jgi:hypothetical protein
MTESAYVKRGGYVGCVAVLHFDSQPFCTVAEDTSFWVGLELDLL